MSNLILASLALFLCTAVRAQGDPTLWTSWVPLAVRSPYLSTWMATTNVPFNASNVDGVARAPTNWPQFLQSGVSNLLETAADVAHASRRSTGGVVLFESTRHELSCGSETLVLRAGSIALSSPTSR